MKRILSLFLAAAVLISCLTITAFADNSNSSFQSSIIDMLPAVDYDIYSDDTLYKTNTKPVATINPKGTKYRITWEPLTASRITGVNFCLWSGVKPDSVRFYRDGDIYNNCTLVSSDGYFYYYRYETSTAFDYNSVSVEAYYSDSTTVNFGLINLFGIVPDAKKVSQVSIAQDLEYFDGYYQLQSISSYTNYTLPKSFDYAWQVSHFSYYSVRFNIPASNASSLSFNFTSLGSIVLNTGVTVSLYKNGSLFMQLPVEVIEGMNTSTILPNGKAILYSYTCNVDLTDIDLTNCQFMLRLEIDSTLSDGLYLSKLNLLNVAYKDNVYEIPWYRQFFGWISNVMTSGYQSIVDAINGEGNSEMENAADQMEGAANDLNQSANAFDQVETPDIDAGALTGGLTNFSVSGLAVLGVITANPYVTSLLVLVFTFALCAYIFFGRKR